MRFRRFIDFISFLNYKYELENDSILEIKLSMIISNSSIFEFSDLSKII